MEVKDIILAIISVMGTLSSIVFAVLAFRRNDRGDHKEAGLIRILNTLIQKLPGIPGFFVGDDENKANRQGSKIIKNMLILISFK